MTKLIATFMILSSISLAKADDCFIRQDCNFNSSKALSFVSNDLVSTARRYVGEGWRRFGRPSLWCARFLNHVLKEAGYKGTGSDMARSFAAYGRRVSGPRIGAIAVMRRGRRGGHVGVVSGIDGRGNPIIISGNHNRRVGIATYPRHRIYAYVIP